MDTRLDDLIMRLIGSIVALEHSEWSDEIYPYDIGYVSGEHDAYIDILDSLGVEHNFTKYIQGEEDE